MKICDRCGEIIPPNEKKNYPYYKIIISKCNSNYTDEPIDLCTECRKAVIIFIKGKKYVEEI